MGSHGNAAMIKAMARFERKYLRDELKACKRPEAVQKINSDPKELERLQRIMEQARKWQWPSSYSLNV